MSDGRIQRRVDNLLTKGTRALHDGKPSEAATLLERAQSLQPDNIDVLLNLSGAYILTKKFKQAVVVLEQLKELEPDNAMIWTNLGAAYLGNPVLAKDEDQQKAIAAFERALALQPQAPHVAYNLGLVHRDRAEYAKALQWFQQAAEHNPQDSDAHYYIEQMKEKLAQNT
ncbi:MAG: tetratricopeptide repeat protein [Anaerolineales bacterium]|nr:tetratricopeptide repeat protein [Anaerolineales bacterium]